MLACDLVVMAQEASLGLPEVRLGLTAAAGGLLRLPQQIPEKIASELILTGDPIDAPSALRWGLANRVVPADELLEAATALAEKIAQNAPLALGASKRSIHRWAGRGTAWDRDLWAENDAEFDRLLASRDAIEGMQAFAERRPAVWQGA